MNTSLNKVTLMLCFFIAYSTRDIEGLNKSLTQKNKKTINMPIDLKIQQKFLVDSENNFQQMQKDAALKLMNTTSNISDKNLEIPHIAPSLEIDDKSSKRILREAEQASEPNEKSHYEEEDEDEEDEGDDKLTDIEERLYSIEDKIDHLLLHAGHDLRHHTHVMTPWGIYAYPEHNNDSINHKLTMIDHMGHGIGHMGMGMGHMDMGIGMGINPMGSGHLGIGLHHAAHAAHSMGLGHANPYGEGLGHAGGASFLPYGGRLSAFPSSSNPYYGSGSYLI